VCDTQYNGNRGDNMQEVDEITNGLLIELRRGTIVLSVLSQLDEPKYGYSLLQSLEGKGVNIDTGTLYPLLRRLEKQEILLSEWETKGTKPRKYYVLNDLGKAVYQKLCKEWKNMVENMDKLIKCKEDI
jgi:PadR family transcriptional regulator, regulatory protein PadR